MNGQQLSKRAAKRMWAALRRHLQQGGWLLFDQYGKGGWWYSSDGEQPIMDSTDIPIACLAYEGQLLSLDRFAEATQHWLDQRTADRERDAIDVAAGY